MPRARGRGIDDPQKTTSIITLSLDQAPKKAKAKKQPKNKIYV
jgi:hypothetical protein